MMCEKTVNHPQRGKLSAQTLFSQVLELRFAGFLLYFVFHVRQRNTQYDNGVQSLLHVPRIKTDF